MTNRHSKVSAMLVADYIAAFERKGVPATASALAKLLGVTLASVVAPIRWLFNNGYIQKCEDGVVAGRGRWTVLTLVKIGGEPEAMYFRDPLGVMHRFVPQSDETVAIMERGGWIRVA